MYAAVYSRFLSDTALAPRPNGYRCPRWIPRRAIKTYFAVFCRLLNAE